MVAHEVGHRFTLRHPVRVESIQRIVGLDEPLPPGVRTALVAGGGLVRARVVVERSPGGFETIKEEAFSLTAPGQPLRVKTSAIDKDIRDLGLAIRQESAPLAVGRRGELLMEVTSGFGIRVPLTRKEIALIVPSTRGEETFRVRFRRINLQGSPGSQSEAELMDAHFSVYVPRRTLMHDRLRLVCMKSSGEDHEIDPSQEEVEQ